MLKNLSEKNSLSSLFRFSPLSPTIRTVVEYGLYMKHCKVEVYLLNFKLSLHPKLSETITKSFSRADTVGEFCYDLCVAIYKCLEKHFSFKVA